MSEDKWALYRSKNTWSGRSLKNYVAAYPKAKGARSLTEARRMAHGEKTKQYGCRCGQAACKRSTGKGGDHC